jgi:lysophospholipase L1-like esterase
MRRLLVLGAVGAVLASAALIGRDAWIARKLAYLDGFDPASVKCGAAEPASEATRPRLYMVGDSLAEDWPLQGFDPRYEPVACGMSGETTAQLEQRFDRFDFLHQGDVVVLVSGVYDAVGAAFAPPERLAGYAARAAARLLRLARLARENGGRVIVATILPPFDPEIWRRPFWSESIRDFTATANADLRATDWGPGIELLDVARALGGDDRHTPDIWGRGGLKPNALGYGALTAEINRRLAQAPAAAPPEAAK